MTTENSKHIDFLIIGAGPFGLSLASYCEHHGLEYPMLGKPMSFWEEGRLKLEPWLKTRIDAGNVNVWPQSQMHNCEVTSDNAVKVTFMSGETVQVDHIVLATGYMVNMHNIPFLKTETFLTG